MGLQFFNPKDRDGGLVFFTIFIFLINFSPKKQALAEHASYHILARALTGNSGGQDAISLRRSTDTNEISLFMNRYLIAGDKPLVGGNYSVRFPVCGQRCFWQFYTQLGIGLSTAGPMAEVLWGSVFLWMVRIDIATHVFVTEERPVLWHYPFWFGISFPSF